MPQHKAPYSRSLRARVLDEYRDSPITHPDPQLQTLLRAIFLEDCLAITLTDADLAPGGLEDPTATIERVPAD